MHARPKKLAWVGAGFLLICALSLTAAYVIDHGVGQSDYRIGSAMALGFLGCVSLSVGVALILTALVQSYWN